MFRNYCNLCSENVKVGKYLLKGKIMFLQALSLKEKSEQKEFEDAVRTGLTDEEKQRIEDQQLKQKAIAEKDLVGSSGTGET